MKNALKPGDWVRSRYRAPWYGKVILVNKFGCAVVELILDRHRKPFAKQSRTSINCAWLVKLDSEPTAC